MWVTDRIYTFAASLRPPQPHRESTVFPQCVHCRRCLHCQPPRGVKSASRLRAASTVFHFCFLCVHCLQCLHCPHCLGSPSSLTGLSRASRDSSLFAMSTLSKRLQSPRPLQCLNCQGPLHCPKCLECLQRLPRRPCQGCLHFQQCVTCSYSSVFRVPTVFGPTLLSRVSAVTRGRHCLQRLQSLGYPEGLQRRQCLQCLQRLHCLGASKVFAVPSTLHAV